MFKLGNRPRTAWSRAPFKHYLGSRYLTSKCSDGKTPDKSDKGGAKTEIAKCEESGVHSPGKATSGGDKSPPSSTGAPSSGEIITKLGDRQTVQNFHADCIGKINAQINSELTSAYVYLSMASFCRQDNVALLGFAKYFSNGFTEEIEHAQKFVLYLSARGGALHLTPIAAPARHEWESIERLLAEALDMEKQLNAELLALHACASSHGDAHLSDFLEAEYLPEQVQAIKQLADLVTIVRRLGCCCVHVVDRDMMNGAYSNHGT